MYTSRICEDLGLVVGLYTGHRSVDADHASCIQSILETDAAAVRRGVPLVCVIVTDPDTPQPPALWRKRMAEANNAIQAERYYFALVTSSVLIRGVMTAIRWFVRQRPGRDSATFASIEEAAGWVRTNTGRNLPIAALHADARRGEAAPKPFADLPNTG